ncbi:FAD/NAD(P)-binding protein [Rhodobacter capsulatus]|uniref:FAD/NAD(P)-binding protein n=1 Tax=Rhodobacter capsulatus TaxID=1061 RepID=UPI0040268C11
MTAQPPLRRHVLVIGGGASGVLMAFHVLRAASETRVTLIERSPGIGIGLAYATEDPDHLLNTRVINMSALPEDPEHFLRWLWQANRAVSGASFVSRATYGRYLESLLAPWASGPRLRLVQAEAVRLTEAPPGRVTLTLDDGQTVIADHAILATGHPRPVAVRGLQADVTQVPLDPDLPVAILGTGLSMVDQVTTLLKSGHRGTIFALSRRGLLPRVHGPGTPLATSLGEVPLGAPASVLLHWLRRQVRRAEIAGGTAGAMRSTGCVRIFRGSGAPCPAPSAPAPCATPPPGGRCIATACRPKPPATSPPRRKAVSCGCCAAPSIGSSRTSAASGCITAPIGKPASPC